MGDLNSERRIEILSQLLDAVRSLQSGIDSGRVGFDGAVAEYACQTDNELSHALRVYLDGIRSGATRQEALADVAVRVATPEVQAFVDALVRACTEHISLSATLQSQYAELEQGLRQLRAASQASGQRARS